MAVSRRPEGQFLMTCPSKEASSWASSPPLPPERNLHPLDIQKYLFKVQKAGKFKEKSSPERIGLLGEPFPSNLSKLSRMNHI